MGWVGGGRRVSTLVCVCVCVWRPHLVQPGVWAVGAPVLWVGLVLAALLLGQVSAAHQGEGGGHLPQERHRLPPRLPVQLHPVHLHTHTRTLGISLSRKVFIHSVCVHVYTVYRSVCSKQRGCVSVWGPVCLLGSFMLSRGAGCTGAAGEPGPANRHLPCQKDRKSVV